jgi:hypothetical protein
VGKLIGLFAYDIDFGFVLVVSGYERHSSDFGNVFQYFLVGGCVTGLFCDFAVFTEKTNAFLWGHAIVNGINGSDI